MNLHIEMLQITFLYLMYLRGSRFVAVVPRRYREQGSVQHHSVSHLQTVCSYMRFKFHKLSSRQGMVDFEISEQFFVRRATCWP